MFNKTTINKTETKYVPYEKSVKVTELKAPTDESIKLLNEMQLKATENIIKTIKINNSVCEAIAVIFQKNIVEDRIDYLFKVLLNGKEFIFDGYLDREEEKKIYLESNINGQWFNVDDFVNRTFHKKLCEIISTEILNQTKYHLVETIFNKQLP